LWMGSAGHQNGRLAFRKAGQNGIPNGLSERETRDRRSLGFEGPAAAGGVRFKGSGKAFRKASAQRASIGAALCFGRDGIERMREGFGSSQPRKGGPEGSFGFSGNTDRNRLCFGRDGIERMRKGFGPSEPRKGGPEGSFGFRGNTDRNRLCFGRDGIERIRKSFGPSEPRKGGPDGSFGFSGNTDRNRLCFGRDGIERIRKSFGSSEPRTADRKRASAFGRAAGPDRMGSPVLKRRTWKEPAPEADRTGQRGSLASDRAGPAGEGEA
jgi:hypothetical protein